MPRKTKVIERTGAGRKTCHSIKYRGIMASDSIKIIRTLVSDHYLLGVMSHALPNLVGLLISLLVVFYVYSAAVASWHLRNATYFTGGQRLAQLAMVWLLPIVGVAIVLSMLVPEERKRRPGWVPLLEPFILAV